MSQCNQMISLHKDLVKISKSKVRLALEILKTNKAAVKDNAQAKVIKHLADELKEPLRLATGLTYGGWSL